MIQLGNHGYFKLTYISLCIDGKILIELNVHKDLILEVYLCYFIL
jgi:hypothetical protein